MTILNSMLMSTPYLVIGYYKPKKYRGSIIGKALTKITKNIGLVPLIDKVHGPQMTSIWADAKLHAEVRRFAQHSQGSQWHQDGDLADGSTMNHCAVLWAAKAPTEFKVADGNVYRPKPFELVIARNLNGHHRSPPDCPTKPTRRWFFRQRVEIVDHCLDRSRIEHRFVALEVHDIFVRERAGDFRHAVGPGGVVAGCHCDLSPKPPYGFRDSTVVCSNHQLADAVDLSRPSVCPFDQRFTGDRDQRLSRETGRPVPRRQNDQKTLTAHQRHLR